jgi:hypothetical protein
MATDTISIRYINNDAGGFNGNKLIAAGMTIAAFFRAMMPDRDAKKYNIRVNNAVPAPDQVLVAGDQVSIVPGKYDGGAVIDELAALLEASPGLMAHFRAEAEEADCDTSHIVLSDGFGFGKKIALHEDDDGETIGDFFARQFPGAMPESYKIRVNGGAADADTVLEHEDNVEISRIAR